MIKFYAHQPGTNNLLTLNIPQLRIINALLSFSIDNSVHVHIEHAYSVSLDSLQRIRAFSVLIA